MDALLKMVLLLVVWTLVTAILFDDLGDTQMYLILHMSSSIVVLLLRPLPYQVAEQHSP